MKFKRLIPALAMLLVSAILLGTSTFAWFSMNTNVTATGMQVNIKSDNTFLLIGEAALTNAAGVQGQTGTDLTTEDLTVADNDARVYPSAPATTAGEVAYISTTSGHKTTAGDDISVDGALVTNKATAAAVTNWYTANALTVDDEAIDTATAKQLADFTGYVIKKTVLLTVAEGSNNANNLTVTATIAKKSGAANTDVIDGVRVLVATDDGGFTIITPAQSGTAIDIKGTNTAITDTTVRTVDIYIYYDGNDETVYTNNAANLKAADISIAFDVDSVPAA